MREIIVLAFVRLLFGVGSYMFEQIGVNKKYPHPCYVVITEFLMLLIFSRKASFLGFTV